MIAHPTSGLPDFRTSGRSGFTLVEILVSLMIFTVVSGAMLGMLFQATDLYRRTEAGRAATDEAVSVLAALDADLLRMTAQRDGGWFYTEAVLANGSMAVAWLARHEDPGRTRVDVGSNRVIDERQIVVWWTDPNDRLLRATLSEPAPNATMTGPERCAQAVDGFLANPSGEVITTGCLHFSATASLPDSPRDRSSYWTAAMVGDLQPQLVAGVLKYDSSLGLGFPETVLFRIGLTGGTRFAPKGFLIEENSGVFRIAGIKAVPSTPGSYARLNGSNGNDEWIGYRLSGPGLLDTTASGSDSRIGRQRLNSTTGTWARGVEVEFAQFHALVRALPW